MVFREILVQERKARGLSQEELAAKIQVSRQAVSKWETGDAAPDLNKLLLLADALDMSLDALCGREGPVPAAADMASAAADLKTVRSGKARWVWLALCVLLALCLAAGSLWWKTSAPGENTLPDIITADGVHFGVTELNGVRRLTCSFVPSAVGDTYTYAVTFAGDDGSSQMFPAACEGGVCTTDQVDLSLLNQSASYTVTALVSSGRENRPVLLATNFTIDSSSVSWQPAE